MPNQPHRDLNNIYILHADIDYFFIKSSVWFGWHWLVSYIYRYFSICAMACLALGKKVIYIGVQYIYFILFAVWFVRRWLAYYVSKYINIRGLGWLVWKSIYIFDVVALTWHKIMAVWAVCALL